MLPGGKEVEWSWDTLTNIAKVLDRRFQWQLTARVERDDEFVPNPDFDKTKIVQYGYVPQFSTRPALAPSGLPGPRSREAASTPQIPRHGQEAWKWWYDGMWGEQPFIPTEAVIQSPDFGAGNPFNGGKVAMGVTQMWYTCCIKDASESWDLAVPTKLQRRGQRPR